MTAAPRIAICPGSFDPMTLGHEEIIRRALAFADRVIVGVSYRPSHQKTGLLPVEQRLEVIREVFVEEPRITALAFTGLLVDFAREHQAAFVVRGLRGTSDFDYEAQMARVNGTLAPGLETIFLVSSPGVSFISSSLVRQITALGGDLAPFVSPAVARRLAATAPPEPRGGA
jgi:pantetheine-phosphate adenylyltransferase